MNDNRSASMLEDSATIRDRIRRSYLFLVLNRNLATRKALERLIKQAEAQLSLSLSAERIETRSTRLPGIDRKA